MLVSSSRTLCPFSVPFPISSFFFSFSALANHILQKGGELIQLTLAAWAWCTEASTTEYAGEIRALMMTQRKDQRDSVFVCQWKETATALLPPLSFSSLGAVLFMNCPCNGNTFGPPTPLCAAHQRRDDVFCCWANNDGTNPLHLVGGALNPTLKPSNHAIYWSI